MTDKERSRKIIEQERKRECYTRLRRVVSPQKCVRLWLVVGSYAKATIGDFTEEIVHQSRKIENVRSQSSLWHPLSPIRTDDPANNRFLPRVRQRGRGTPCAPYVFLKTMELNCRILSFHRWNEFCKRVFPFGRIFSNFEKNFFFLFFILVANFENDGLKKRREDGIIKRYLWEESTYKKIATKSWYILLRHMCWVTRRVMLVFGRRWESMNESIIYIRVKYNK